MKHFARKKRQLSYASKQLVLLDSKGLQKSEVFKKYLVRVQSLYNQLRFRIRTVQLKKIIGGAILFLSIGTSSNSLKSQTPEFAEPQWDPFGLNISDGSKFGLDCQFIDIDDDGDLDMLTPLYNYDTYELNIAFDINSGTPELAEFSGTTKSLYTLESLLIYKIQQCMK